MGRAARKADFFDNAFRRRRAFFDITKTNIPKILPPTIPATSSSRAPRKARANLEFDLTGRVNENWSLIANYTHDDARVTIGAPYNPVTEITTENAVVGNQLPSVPLNQGNLWVKCDALGALEGLSVAGGLNVVGSSQGDNANSFQLPQYTLVNGMISYRFPWQGAKITAQLNVKNFFDTTYYAASSNRYTITPGTPRTILASLRVEF